MKKYLVEIHGVLLTTENNEVIKTPCEHCGKTPTELSSWNETETKSTKISELKVLISGRYTLKQEDLKKAIFFMLEEKEYTSKQIQSFLQEEIFNIFDDIECFIDTLFQSLIITNEERIMLSTFNQKAFNQNDMLIKNLCITPIESDEEEITRIKKQ